MDNWGQISFPRSLLRDLSILEPLLYLVSSNYELENSWSKMTDTPENQAGNDGSPVAEPDSDGTLGGYLRFHDRPPGFEGVDGHPYTVSMEIEKTPDLQAPFSGYLVFPRWADTGVGIMGHLETPLLFHGPSRETVSEQLEALSLLEVNDLLKQAIQRRQPETE